MSTIITRLFESNEHATAVVAELKRNLFTEDSITVVSSETNRPVEELMATGLSESAARAYAEGVLRGGKAIVVRAPFGRASLAIRVLDQFSPTDVGVPDTYQSTVDIAAPLSDWLGLPVLSRNPAPLSSLLGIRTLTEGGTQTKLIEEPAPLSRALGLPLLSSNPAPLSSAVRLKTLAGGAAPLSSSLRLPLLSNNPSPLSRLLGLPVCVRCDSPIAPRCSRPRFPSAALLSFTSSRARFGPVERPDRQPAFRRAQEVFSR